MNRIKEMAKSAVSFMKGTPQRVKAGFKNFHFTRKVFSYPYILFLLLFVVVPTAMIIVRAFISEGKLSFDNFTAFFTDGASLITLGNSILIGVLTTVICLLVGYPVAFILSKMNSGKVLVMLFVLPMWVNFLIRTLATKALFQAASLPLGLGAVLFCMVYNYLPFMILPLHTTISGIDKSYVEAAQDLGADKVTVFVKTILPLSLPGIISGITMVFIPTISTFAITEFLRGNSDIYLFGDSIYIKFMNNAWGVGAVMSIIMLIMVLISNFFMSKLNDGNESSQVGAKLW